MQLAIEELRTLEELDALAPRWHALWERCPEATVFQRPEWQLSYCRHLLAGELRVATLWSAGTLVGLAPFFRWEREGVGVLSLLGAGVSDYQDLLIAPDQRETARGALAAWLASTRAEQPCWEWSELCEGSLLREIEVARRAADSLEPQEVCPALALTGSWSELLAGLTPKLRRDLPYARRRAEREDVHIERADIRSFDATFEGLLAAHRARRDALGDATVFATPRQLEFQRAAARALFAANQVDLYGLYQREQQVGAFYVLRDRDARRLYQCGFDPAAGVYGPGCLSIAFVLERASEEGARLADFLRGDEPYKYRWGARDRVRLARRRVRLAA